MTELGAGEVAVPAWTQQQEGGGGMEELRSDAECGCDRWECARHGVLLTGGKASDADLAALERARTCGAVADEDGPPAVGVRYSQLFHPKYPGMTAGEARAEREALTMPKSEHGGMTPDTIPGGYDSLGGGPEAATLTSGDLNADVRENCKAPPPLTSVLTEAETAVNGPRQRDYQHPVINFALIAQDWRAWIFAAHGIDVPIDGRDVAMMNIGQKRCREAYRRKYDNRVDTCGYMRALQLGEESALLQFYGESVPDAEKLPDGMLSDTWGYLLTEE